MTRPRESHSGAVLTQDWCHRAQECCSDMPATYSPTVPAGSSPRLSLLSTPFHPHLRLLPGPPQTPQLCTRPTLGLECLSCPEAEIQRGAGTAQCPQVTHFTNATLHSSAVGHIWLAVADVPINPAFRISSKTAMPREGGNGNNGSKKSVYQRHPKDLWPEREFSSPLHLGNTRSSPPPLEGWSTEAGLGNSSPFPPSSTSQTYFRAEVLFHRDVTGDT